MSERIRVAILDDHQAIIDGYSFRLSKDPNIEIVDIGLFGEALEPMLERGPVDVLLLDVSMPTSSENLSPYPILHLIPKLLQNYPNLSILVISMHAQRTLINAVMEAGASGFILKDDQGLMRELAGAVHAVARGEIQLSQFAYQQLRKDQGAGTGVAHSQTGVPHSQTGVPHSQTGVTHSQTGVALSHRQLEVLSLCAAYSDASTADLAKMMNIANSTVRNLLSGAYLKLNVRSRSAAVAKARQIGLIAPEPLSPIQ